MNKLLMPAELQTDCHASREFLLNTPIVPQYRVIRQPPGNAQIQWLKSEYPDMLSGDTLINKWRLDAKDGNAFGAMAIKVDGDDAEVNPEDGVLEADRLIRLAAAIDENIKNQHEIWGLVHQGMLGLFFFEPTPTYIVHLSEKIRKNYIRHTDDSISIGIAAYPEDGFPKERIMDNAVKALDHAAFLGPNTTVRFDSISLNISGDRLYTEGKIAESIVEFEHALRLDPSNVNARNSLGVCFGVLKDYQGALAQFEATIQTAPGEVMATYNYGLVKLLMQRPNQALDYFLQAERLRDDIFEVAFHIGKVYLQLDQPENGLKYLSKAEALNSKSGGVYRLLGHCHDRLGDKDRAIDAYTRAIRINPDDAEALSELGHQYDLRNQNSDIATLFCEQSTHIEPQNGQYHHRLARLYLKTDKVAQALVSFKKAQALGYDSRVAIDEINALLSDDDDEKVDTV